MLPSPQLPCCQRETLETQAEGIFPWIDALKLELEAYICDD